MADESIRPDYESQTIRLTDLTVTKDVVAGKVFSNCQIVGPAIVLFRGSTILSDCAFDGAGGDPASSLFYPVESERWLIGAIALDSCEFYGCRFTRIGLLLPEGQEEIFRRGLAAG